MAKERATLLTELQRSYLRLVHAGHTSKEIAQRLDASHHTVNSQIAVAVRVLGARSRSDAAALLAEIEAGGPEADGSYDRSYDAEAIAEPPPERPVIGSGERPSEGLPLPVPTSGRPRNDLTPLQRVLWILVLAAMIALIVGGLISGITAQLDGLGRRV